MGIAKEDNKCTIMWQNNTSQGNISFVEALFEVFEEGYKYEWTGLTDDEPQFTPMYKRVVLYKENKTIEDEAEVNDLSLIIEDQGKEDDEIEDPVDILNSLTKKKALLDFAKKIDVEVSEDMIHPASIKKLLKEKLSK